MCLNMIRANGNMVPCRKCPECVIKRQNEWIFRIKQELKLSANGWFITLTYNEKNVPKIFYNKLDGEIITTRKQIQSDVWQFQCQTLLFSDVQLFFKRLRRQQHKRNVSEGKNWNKVMYYVVGEYGDKTKRPHYHAIIFNADYEQIRDAWTKVSGDSTKRIGNIGVGAVEHNSIRYVVKYMSKRVKEAPELAEKPKATMSLGLGAGYIKHHKQFHRINNRMYVVEENGYKISMPEYYRKKIFDDHKILKHIRKAKEDNKLMATPIENTEFQRFVEMEIAAKRMRVAKYNEKKLRENSQSNKM